MVYHESVKTRLERSAEMPYLRRERQRVRRFSLVQLHMGG